MTSWQKLHDDQQFKERLYKRSEITQAIRAFFSSKGFLEVETPLLVANPGTEPYLEVFETELKVLDGRKKRGFLLTSPELAMKKLLVAGIPKLFQLCKSFRNGEGVSSSHNHEFTILEWYRAGADYRDLMVDCEQLLLSIIKLLNPESNQLQLIYQQKKYDLTPPWERLSVAEAFERYAKVPEAALHDRDQMIEVAKNKGYSVGPSSTWEEAYNQVFLNEVEPKLGATRPTFLYDYPVAQAALSRRKPSDARYAERFELYLAGLELANAFSELTDWQEQNERMKSDLVERAALGKTPYGVDADFIAALKEGMPDSAGIALGVDRLVMLCTDVASIHDVLLFPVSEAFSLDAD